MLRFSRLFSAFAKLNNLDVFEAHLLKASIGEVKSVLLWSLAASLQPIKALMRALKRDKDPELPGDVLPEREKCGLRVLFTASDNSSSSGAFRSMVALAAMLRDTKEIDPIVVLPYRGTGTELLIEAKLPHLHVSSADWTVPLQTNRRCLRFAIGVIRKTRLNHKAKRTIADIIRQYDVDLVHINTSWCYVGALAAIQTGKPFVWHIREFLEEDQGRTIWSRPAGISLMSRAKAILSISKSVFEKYSSLIPAGKHKLVYNGIDESRFLLPGRRILATQPYTLIMVGDFRRHKGHVEFSMACASLYGKGLRNFRVWFVGEGDPSVKNECKSVFEKAGMVTTVTFFGRQVAPERFLKQADIAFTCSRSEAFGRVTVEAMMAGCLVIGSRSAGTSELIEDGETGLLFELGDNEIHNIADRADWAMRHPDRSRTIAAAGTNKALRCFTAKRNAAEIEGIYHEILQESRTS